METIAQDHNLRVKEGKENNQIKKPDRAETAQYIADMVLELRNLAKAVEIKPLQDLLEMCFYEAFATANRVAIPEGEIERLRELSKASAQS